jgi:hypothetical protein
MRLCKVCEPDARRPRDPPLLTTILKPRGFSNVAQRTKLCHGIKRVLVGPNGSTCFKSYIRAVVTTTVSCEEAVGAN